VNWTAANNGLTNNWVNALLVSNSEIFAGTYGGGVFRSQDNGSSWSTANIGLTDTGGGDTNVSALTTSANFLLAGANSGPAPGGLFSSPSDGYQWSAVDFGSSSNYILSFAGIDNYVFAGTQGGGIFRSTDAGIHWTAVNLGLQSLVVTALIINGTMVFAGTSSGVFFSGNKGVRWTVTNTGLADTLINSLAVSGYTLLAGTDKGIWSRPLADFIETETDDSPSSTIALYPNPSNDWITITTGNQQENKQVTLYTVAGQKLTSQSGFEDIHLSVEEYSRGVYFAKIICTGSTKVIRFIKK
jgi:hypothetical protein